MHWKIKVGAFLGINYKTQSKWEIFEKARTQQRGFPTRPSASPAYPMAASLARFVFENRYVEIMDINFY